MDKYELSIKTEQLAKLIKQEDYQAATQVADSIEWKKIKQWSIMSNAIYAYSECGMYDKARNVCVYAYNRNLGGRRLLILLTEMYINLEEFEDAEDVYSEFVEVAPRDTSRFILKYKMRKAQNASIDELIEILQEYKENEYEDSKSNKINDWNISKK